MNENVLRDVDTLRARADLSYEEAIALLEANDGDVMRALVELEKQGRTHTSQSTGSSSSSNGAAYDDIHAAKAKAESFFKRACKTRLVVERNREDGERSTVANLSAPFAIGATILAPYIALGSAALAFFLGYKVSVKKES